VLKIASKEHSVGQSVMVGVENYARAIVKETTVRQGPGHGQKHIGKRVLYRSKQNAYAMEITNNRQYYCYHQCSAMVK
jgi:hypothetical protein